MNSRVSGQCVYTIRGEDSVG